MALAILRRLEETEQFAVLHEEASRCFEGRQDVRFVPLIALAHAHLGDQVLALSFYSQAAQSLGRLEASSLTDLASVDCVLGRLDAAERLLTQVLETYSNHPPVLSRDSTRAPARAPTPARALARLAWCRHVQQRLDDARELYERAIDLGINRLPVRLEYVRLLVQLGEFESAQTSLDEAIEVFSGERTELAEAVQQDFVARLRHCQLELWVVSDALGQAEFWLDSRQADLPEDQWVDLLVHYTHYLVAANQHSIGAAALHKGLKFYPDQQALLLRLSELAVMQGHFVQAIVALQRAVYFNKNQPWLLRRLADVYQLMGDHERAKGNIAKLNEQLALASDTDNAGDAKDKDDAGGQAQTAKPNTYIEASRQSVFSALSSHLLSHLPSHLSSSPSKPQSLRIKRLYRLAAAHDQRGSHDKAFAFAGRGSALVRKELRYDAREHRNECARIRCVFSRGLFEHRKELGVDTDVPVFVVGLPRSGASLVADLLSLHGQVINAGELGVIPSCVSGLERWERHTGSARQWPDCVDDLSPTVSKGLAQGIMQELKQLAANVKPDGVQASEWDAMRVVDYLPTNSKHIGFIKLLFPRAKIISVRRDPHEIAVSNYFYDCAFHRIGREFTYDLTELGQQIADHHLLMHHWQQLFPADILEVKYEDLVTAPDACAKTMFAHLGLPWQSELAHASGEHHFEPDHLQQQHGPAHHWQKYARQLQPLVAAANAPIKPDPIKDLVVLPVPGFLEQGVAHHRKGELRDAEIALKKLLHHLPNHAAANYMLGAVFSKAGYFGDAIPYLEKAVKICPWHKDWQDQLALAQQALSQG